MLAEKITKLVNSEKIESSFRLPTILELFGNQGVVVANPSLVPERAISYDAAITGKTC